MSKEKLMGFFRCDRCEAKTLYKLMPKDAPKYPQCQFCGLTQLMKDKERGAE